MEIKNTKDWAEEVFGSCDLGDLRRLSRLIDYGARQAAAPASSVAKACGDVASSEASYRLLRNENIKAKDIDEGPFECTADLCRDRRVVLAIQDTTDVEVSRSHLRKELFEKGCPIGFVVHSTLMVDGDNGDILGLIDQERWIRSKSRPGKAKRALIDYENKESYKWEAAQNRMEERLGNLSNVITVCDREADIFEFLMTQQEEARRYVVRCSRNRKIIDEDKLLWDAMESLPFRGFKNLEIAQRGPSVSRSKKRAGRKSRSLKLEIRSGKCTILCPAKLKDKEAKAIELNAVYVIETNPEDEDPLCWRLLTTEPVDTLEQVLSVIGYYEKRWRIEEFHKCWKSGVRVEERNFETIDTIERFLAISAPIAVRLLQIHHTVQTNPELDCESILATDEWQCLHTMMQPQKALPKAPPTIKWAYTAIAKLAGFRDSKGTGRAGWETIWYGWSKFQAFFLGWQAAKRTSGQPGANL